MAHQDGTFPRIIRWPCDKLPYRKTIRACFYRYRLQTGWREVFVALMGIPAAVLVGIFAVVTPGNPVAIVLLTLISIVVAATVVNRLLYRRILSGMRLNPNDPATFRPGFKDAERLASEWREKWLNFEKQSTTHMELLRQPSTAELSPVAIVDRGPQLPAYWYRPTDGRDNTVAKVTIARDPNRPSDIAITADQILAQARARLFFEVSRSLAHVHPDAVLGYAVMSGTWTLVSIFMHGPNVQVWTLFQVQQSGMSLSCRLQTGYHWWFDETYSTEGSHYHGDVRAFKRAGTHENLKGTALILAGVAVPIVGWGILFLASFPALFVLAKRTWRDLRYGEFSRQSLTQINPEAGDSIDLDLLSFNRLSVTKKYYPFVLTNATQSQIEGLRQTITNVVQEAVTLCIRSPRDGVAINWSADLEGVVR